MEIVFYSAKSFNIFLSLYQQISTVCWIKTEIKNKKLSKYYTTSQNSNNACYFTKKTKHTKQIEEVNYKRCLTHLRFSNSKEIRFSFHMWQNQISITSFCRNPGNNHTPLDTSGIPIGILTLTQQQIQNIHSNVFFIFIWCKTFIKIINEKLVDHIEFLFPQIYDLTRKYNIADKNVLRILLSIQYKNNEAK